MLFALIAGAGTAITPCVLPVLPALLSASAVGGRRRPIGIVLGLGAHVHDRDRRPRPAGQRRRAGQRRGADAGDRRADRVRRGPAGPGAGRAHPGAAVAAGPLRPQDARYGLLVRASASAARWASCARPARARSSPRSPRSAPPAARRRAWSRSSRSPTRSGLGAVMLLYGLGGRAVLDRIRRRRAAHVVERGARRRAADHRRGDGHQPRRALRGRAGQEHEPARLPRSIPTRSLENSTRSRTGWPRCGRPRASPRARASRRRVTPVATHVGVRSRASRRPSLPKLGPAPDFTGQPGLVQHPRRQAADAGAACAGTVVLVDFWTYTCINCIRTLPFLKGLYATYHRYGLDIVGVETPEFTFEQEACNVAQAIESDGLHYPVVQDNNYGTWNAYQNEYWPAEYLIDAHGPGPPHPVRRGQLQAGRGGGPRAALRGRRAHSAAADDRPRDRCPPQGWPRPRPT